MSHETIDDMAPVMGADGEFHAQDEAVDLSGTPVEAWVALGFFWLLGATVFTGATIGVIRNNHIQVDFFYKFMPARMSRVLSTIVDWLRVGFFTSAAVLTVMMMVKLGSNSRMTMVDLPMNWVYGICLLGFAAMAFRSMKVALFHRRRGYSVLERPESTMDDR